MAQLVHTGQMLVTNIYLCDDLTEQVVYPHKHDAHLECLFALG